MSEARKSGEGEPAEQNLHRLFPLTRSLRSRPLPTGARCKKSALHSRVRSRDAPSHPSFASRFKKDLPLKRREAERRKAHGLGAAPRTQMLPPECASGAAARHTGECCHSPMLRARTPSGAPPRRLPRKLMPWLSPGRVSWDVRMPGVTRHALSQSSEAPRRPVVMPAQTMPGTARERGYKPRPQEAHSPHRSAVTGDVPSMGEIR